MDILPKDFLVRILDTHSPSMVAELIGINHNTLIKFIDRVYRIPRKDRAHYMFMISVRSILYSIETMNNNFELRLVQLLVQLYTRITQFHDYQVNPPLAVL